MKKLENQREIIKKKAREVLHEKGINKFSIRTIAKECNIGIGTIYNYYPNKTDLVLELVSDFWIGFTVKAEEVITSKDIFIDKVFIIYNELLEFSKRFRYHLLSKEIDDNEVFNKGMSKHNKAIVIFVNILKKELSKEYIIDDSYLDQVSSFIVHNLITLIKTPTYNYTTFEAVLNDLLSNQERRI